MTDQNKKHPVDEFQSASSVSAKQNWLRAAVLGANDGIVSVAALVVGVASAATTSNSIFIVGIAGLVAGALSMSVGEFVSVSSQRDTEKALLEEERFEIENFPEEELEELAQLYEKKGLKRETAHAVAVELMANDAFAAHADAEHNIDPNDLTNPLHAAFASGISFTVGAVIPLIAIVLPPAPIRVFVTFIAVLAALIITGVVSGHVSGASKSKATIRVVIGGLFAMAVTSGIGYLFGISGI